nr:MAG TPA: hypothetical protein [Caudoviricetes sp.]
MAISCSYRSHSVSLRYSRDSIRSTCSLSRSIQRVSIGIYLVSPAWFRVSTDGTE